MAILDKKNLPIEIHSVSETISVQDGDLTQDFEISQLVCSGGLVVSIIQDESDTVSSKKQKTTAVHLVAAENCELSAAVNSRANLVEGRVGPLPTSVSVGIWT